MYRALRKRNIFYASMCILFLLNFFAFAEGEKGADGEVVAEGGMQAQENLKVRAYSLNLKQLIEESKRNIRKVDKELRERDIRNRNKEREKRARKHFEAGNAFYKEGKLKEAKAEWMKVLEITNNPQMKSYIKKSLEKS